VRLSGTLPSDSRKYLLNLHRTLSSTNSLIMDIFQKEYLLSLTYSSQNTGGGITFLEDLMISDYASRRQHALGKPVVV
jgi:hypothetical protein